MAAGRSARLFSTQSASFSPCSVTGLPQAVFADACSRTIANALPLTSDYRLIQHGERRLELIADCSPAALAHCQAQLMALFARQSIATDRLEWRLTAQAVLPQFDRKRRRIVRRAEEA